MASYVIGDYATNFVTCCCHKTTRKRKGSAEEAGAPQSAKVVAWMSKVQEPVRAPVARMSEAQVMEAEIATLGMRDQFQ